MLPKRRGKIIKNSTKNNTWKGEKDSVIRIKKAEKSCRKKNPRSWRKWKITIKICKACSLYRVKHTHKRGENRIQGTLMHLSTEQAQYLWDQKETPPPLSLSYIYTYSGKFLLLQKNNEINNLIPLVGFKLANKRVAKFFTKKNLFF